MAKEDYQEKVEELRQEIELEDTAIKRSRSSRHGKAKTKKQKNPMMKLLVFVFILIPLGILFYVWFLFEPEVPNEVVNEADDKGIVVEIQNQPSADAKAPIENEDDSADDEAAKQAAAAEETEAVEIKKAEGAQAAAAAKLEEQKRLAAEQAAAAEEARKAQQAVQASTAKSHTVLSTDNLYRIALKYYGNGSAEYVNKIKQANGLTSDSISAGQVLMIP